MTAFDGSCSRHPTGKFDLHSFPKAGYWKKLSTPCKCLQWAPENSQPGSDKSAACSCNERNEPEAEHRNMTVCHFDLLETTESLQVCMDISRLQCRWTWKFCNISCNILTKCKLLHLITQGMENVSLNKQKFFKERGYFSSYTTVCFYFQWTIM